MLENKNACLVLAVCPLCFPVATGFSYHIVLRLNATKPAIHEHIINISLEYLSLWWEV